METHQYEEQDLALGKITYYMGLSNLKRELIRDYVGRSLVGLENTILSVGLCGAVLKIIFKNKEALESYNREKEFYLQNLRDNYLEVKKAIKGLGLREPFIIREIKPGIIKEHGVYVAIKPPKIHFNPDAWEVSDFTKAQFQKVLQANKKARGEHNET